MEALVHFGSSFAPMAAGSLFSASWEGTVLAACVLLGMRMLPRLSAAARSIVWMNVFLLLVLLHFVPDLPSFMPAARSGRPAPVELSVHWSFFIAGAWALLSLIRGVQLIENAIRLRGLASRATPVGGDANLRDLLQIMPAGSRSERTAELCTSTEVTRPSVLGFFHPRILIPPALLERLTAEELAQVVLHEMEHLRRGDDWTNLLQKLALVLFPLNPALFWVERRLCAERELACDDRVVSSNCGRKAYALCLTHLAEYSMLRRSLSLALGAWERQAELVRRVHRILRRPGKPLSARQTWALTGGLTFAGLLCAVALARSPQLVSFAPQTSSVTQASLLPYAGLGVADRDNLGAHAQLVKAIMPQESGQNPMSPKVAAVNDRPTKASPNIVNASTKAVAHKTSRPYTQPQQAWVVMTEWNDFDAAPQVVFTVSQSERGAGKPARVNRVSYAAVPFANGWLLVRI
jgi:beta-lactamase regulating signal transducer with metallopeptidase domain